MSVFFFKWFFVWPGSRLSKQTFHFYWRAAKLLECSMHREQQDSSQFKYLNSLKSSLKILGFVRLPFNAYPFEYVYFLSWALQITSTISTKNIWKGFKSMSAQAGNSLSIQTYQFFTDLHGSSHLPLSLSNALKARQQRDSLRCRRWSWSQQTLGNKHTGTSATKRHDKIWQVQM